MSLVLNGTTGITNLPSINSGQIGGRRNLVINGEMGIDQRNAGASKAVSSYGYGLDRFGFNCSGGGAFTAQRDTTVPAGQGFIYSQKLTVTTADSSIAAADVYSLFHKIEANNSSWLRLGTAHAKTFTLSFWVRSSVTGTFGVGFNNNAFNRSYVATYSISSADTWEKKTITVVGDTAGTWTTGTTIGLNISFDLGGGSNYEAASGSWSAGNFSRTSGSVEWIATSSATFYITGVQLEVGSTATDFEHRSIGEELALCQRYLYKSIGTQAYTAHGLGSVFAAADVDFITSYPVQMRANATASFGGTVSAAKGTTEVNFSSISDVGGSTFNSFLRCRLAASSFTIGDCLTINNNNDATGYIQFDAEL